MPAIKAHEIVGEQLSIPGRAEPDFQVRVGQVVAGLVIVRVDLEAEQVAAVKVVAVGVDAQVVRAKPQVAGEGRGRRRGG